MRRGDAGVEQADDDPSAAFGAAVTVRRRTAAASLGVKAEEQRRVRRLQLVRLLRDRRHEPGHGGQRVDLLRRQTGREAARDVVVRVDEPAVLGQERPVPCLPVAAGGLLVLLRLRGLHVHDERGERVAAGGDREEKERDEAQQGELEAPHCRARPGTVNPNCKWKSGIVVSVLFCSCFYYIHTVYNGGFDIVNICLIDLTSIILRLQ